MASRLSEGYLPTIVIDTRGNTVVDGQIRGALICPEPSFGTEQINCLIQKANERRRVCNTGISNHKCLIVDMLKLTRKLLGCKNMHKEIRVT